MTCIERLPLAGRADLFTGEERLMANDRATGTPVLRRMNTAAVLDAVRRTAPAPQRVTELVELTGLTRPTVAQAVDQLLASGWLLEHEPAPQFSGGGRPAMRVSLNGRAAPVLGLDVGPHTVSAGVSDLSGEVLSLVHRRVRRRGATQVLADVENAMAAALRDAGVEPEDIAMVVVATPGIVDAKSGRVVYAPSLPGWTSIDLVGHLRATFTCPIRIENDANLAALAVAHAHVGEGTVLAVRWGERLGAGVIIDGRLHRGAGAAGEVGFIRQEGPWAPEGDGTLEESIGAPSIVRLARRQAEGRSDTRMAGVTDAAGVFLEAQHGDPVALAVVERVGAVFATALAPALLVLCPDLVVISGGVARAGDILLEVVSRHLTELTLISPRVELSVLAEEATLAGAFRMGLDHVWQEQLTRPTAARTGA